LSDILQQVTTSDRQVMGVTVLGPVCMARILTSAC